MVSELSLATATVQCVFVGKSILNKGPIEKAREYFKFSRPKKEGDVLTLTAGLFLCSSINRNVFQQRPATSAK